ncbi:replication protein A 70 kDa DNA-binding subunit isoform X1 [Carcharodon carcharias]|uniref:replication protein A 70 kDa DNA-binding subunit isoform X1 n=1 Tax=Carcharodon carcharias TaxID=13397 RepID=UPI001B7D929C|nr:replication protein A 70 kDa DNA-binding subunit isoform X1 [Carcharodon carcharias]XP_041053665.1 replication protein A 70 kDa DNA-binding subunit isoform X2 [Carcharodon carcharias]XP_041053666.1 replication protein A 70 kDa DNA-binding subunit isoform X1 [Carcharodon carcharias]
MAIRLSEGAISSIVQGGTPSQPLLQVISIRRITNGPPRYRVLMSDGINTLSSFLLATQLNYMGDEGLIAVNCVCQINRFICNTMKDGRRAVVIVDLKVVKTADQVNGKIGNPVPINEGQTPQPAALANQPAVKPLQNSYASDAASVHSTLVKNENRIPSKPGGIRGLPSSTGGSQIKVVPIACLNPYQSKWTIRARVTNKSQIRTWSNSRGEGKLFSIELLDESGEIRATIFTDQVDKYFPLIEVNKVYFVSKGTLKTANKQYTSVKNDYEMTFNNDTTVIPCDDVDDLPTVQFEFVSIDQLENKNKDTMLDVIGVCKSFEDVTKITVRSNNREVSKRNVYLLDISGKIVSTTLWGEDAEKFDGSQQPVVAIKGARLSDFGGRSLSVLSSSTVMINPDIPEAFKLRAWFDTEGQALEGTSISDVKSGSFAGGSTNWKMLLEVKNENLGHGDKADYYTTVGTVVYLKKENCMYQACPTTECNKKVVDQQNGLYRCEKCDREFTNFKYRMILSVNLADFGENQWVTCFQETAEAILGQNATYLGELKDSNEQAFEEIFQNANFRSYICRIRVKLETYNDESRIKATMMDVKPVDHKEYSKRLIMNIRKHAATQAY